MNDQPEWSGEATLVEETPKSKLAGKTAKKNFLIVRNDFRANIREGDDLSDIPDEYRDNLKTEGVI